MQVQQASADDLLEGYSLRVTIESFTRKEVSIINKNFLTLPSWSSGESKIENVTVGIVRCVIGDELSVYYMKGVQNPTYPDIPGIVTAIEKYKE